MIRSSILTAAVLLVAATPPFADQAATVDSIIALKELSRYEDAESLARAYLGSTEETYGKQSTETAEAIHVLLDVMQKSGNVHGNDALSLGERSVAIRVAIHGADHPEVAPAYHRLGVIRTAVGDNEGAKADIRRAIKILETANDSYASDLARSLGYLARLHRLDENFQESQRLFERAISIQDSSLDPDDKSIASTLYSYAILLRLMGNYGEAEKAFLRTIAIREKVYGPEHDMVAHPTTSLGHLYRIMGRYGDAREFYERSIRIIERVFGPDHEQLTYSLAGLANVHKLIGECERGVALHRRIVAIRQNSLETDHPKLLRGLRDLAGGLLHCNDLRGARDIYEDLLVRLRKARGEDDPEIPTVRGNLGRALTYLGEFDEAEAHISFAVEYYSRVYGPGHLHSARFIHDLGNLEFERSNYSGAAEHYQHAYDIYVDALGEDHPNITTELLGLASALASTGDTSRAIEAALASERVSREHHRLTAPNLAEREALRYDSHRDAGLGIAIPLLNKSSPPDLVESIWDEVIRSRGLVIDEIASLRGRMPGSREVVVDSLRAGLAEARQVLADLVVRGRGDETMEEHRNHLEEARATKERAERTLSMHSERDGEEIAAMDRGYGDVVGAIPNGAALVAFDLNERVAAGWLHDVPPPAYTAFVVTATDAPVAIPLGPATLIDSLVSAWRNGIVGGGAPVESGEIDLFTPGRELRRMIWDPLAESIAGNETILVVPDGSIHLVDFHALPGSLPEHFLIDEGLSIHLLSAERDLCRPSSVPPASGQPWGLFALGGPDYESAAGQRERGLPTEELLVASAAPFRGKRAECGGFDAIRFEPLPGAVRESQLVSKMWGSAHHTGTGGNYTLRNGPEATESSFKTHAPGSRIIHVATHAFFLGGECAAVAENRRGIGGAVGARDDSPVTENPLLLCGLALAGANRRDTAGPDQEDGILTAEEIAALDLTGVEWAVLSACGTGLGQIRAGEGVFGLRRAFEMAGVRTLILSLWPVDDEITLEWMRSLYENRLAGRSTVESVRRASLALLERRRALGLSTHPGYWAGFVATGDRR